jgi:hypothetical protein
MSSKLNPISAEDMMEDRSALGLGFATTLLEGMAEVVDVPSSDLILASR